MWTNGSGTNSVMPRVRPCGHQHMSMHSCTCPGLQIADARLMAWQCQLHADIQCGQNPHRNGPRSQGTALSAVRAAHPARLSLSCKDSTKTHLQLTQQAQVLGPVLGPIAVAPHDGGRGCEPHMVRCLNDLCTFA